MQCCEEQIYGDDEDEEKRGSNLVNTGGEEMKRVDTFKYLESVILGLLLSETEL